MPLMWCLGSLGFDLGYGSKTIKWGVNGYLKIA